LTGLGKIIKMAPGLRAALILPVVVCSAFLATPIAADSKTELDTINQQKVAGATDPEKEIYDELSRMVDAWNRHDIDGYLDTFWRSENLVVVVEGENIRGWDLISKAYHTGYPNLEEMGNMTLDRVQVQILAPDIGFALAWFTASFPKKKEFGTATMTFKKLPEGWRIAIAHSSFVEP
jgi:uncharacterized protein (TIGR02246 family)